MRQVHVDELQPGDELARSVLNSRGVAVAEPGMQLRESAIARLKKMTVNYVYIRAPGYEDIDPEEPVSVPTYVRAKDVFTSLAAEINGKGPWDVDLSLEPIFECTNMMLGDLERSSSTLLYRTGDTLTSQWFAQSLNGTILAFRILEEVGHRPAARDVVRAALLRDLGIWCLEPEFRPSVLRPHLGDTPEEEVVQHAGHSVALLQDDHRVSAHVKAIIAQHHERCEGSGYPRGLRGDSIHDLTYLVAVADTYVRCVQGDDMLPSEALEYLMAGAHTEFDYDTVRAFRQAITPYAIGTEVVLDTGEHGVVEGDGDVRPVVRVLQAADASEADASDQRPRSVDLNKRTNRQIIKVIDN